MKVLLAGYYGSRLFGDSQEADLSQGKIYTNLEEIKGLGFIGDSFKDYAKDNNLNEDSIDEIVNFVENDSLAFAIAFDTLEAAEARLSQEIEWTKYNEKRYTKFRGKVDNGYCGSFDWYDDDDEEE